MEVEVKCNICKNKYAVMLPLKDAAYIIPLIKKNGYICDECGKIKSKLFKERPL